MNMLHICANPKPTEESVAKQLSIAFISAMLEKDPEVEINNVDLYQDPPPFLTYEAYRGFYLPVFQAGYEPTKAEKKAMDYARQQAELFNKADILVLTMPMWNFTVPAIMKAWMDQIMAPGVSYKYGPENLIVPQHKIKKVVLLVSSGGVYKEGDPKDNLSEQVRAAFEYIGIDEVIIAWADGQNPMYFLDHAARKQAAIEAAVEAAEDILEDFQASRAAAEAAEATAVE